MQKIAVSNFRANIHKALRKINMGEGIILTANGKPIAKIIPLEDDQAIAQQKLNSISKTANIKDIISPIDVSWEASE